MCDGRYANMQLIVCGHSLGAGVAALLSLLLRPYFPNLKCYAFSPPGALVSPDLARVM
jgi:sn1-specific diacylglycerol lipase